MSFRPAPLNADLVRLQMKQLAGDVEERPALRSDAAEPGSAPNMNAGPDSKTGMSDGFRANDANRPTGGSKYPKNR